MATATLTHAKRPWRQITSGAWQSLLYSMQRWSSLSASGKCESTARNFAALYEELDRRRTGQAAIAQAVNTLLSKHTN